MRGRSWRVTLAAGTAGVLAGLVPVSATTSGAASAPPSSSVVMAAVVSRTVQAYPAPGTSAAAPATGITFRDVDPGSLGGLQVSGSMSGSHAGTLAAHHDGRGATFGPRVPFTPGERVTVSGVAVAGGEGDHFDFSVAHPWVDPGLQLTEAEGVPARVTSRTAGTLSERSGPPYRTEPSLDPPAIDVTTPADRTAPGLFLATPRTATTSGVMLFGNSGEPIWYKPMTGNVIAGNLEKARYQGQDVLVWFEGRGHGHYQGQWTMVDSTYRTVATIRAASGYQADIHDIDITPDGHALVESYNPVIQDLTALGGQPDARVYETVIQEVEIASGNLLFEWHSLDWIPVADTYTNTRASFVDYMHTNAVQLDLDGNILVGARLLSAAFKINRATHEVMWKLGGRHNRFTFGPAGEPGPKLQHHVLRVEPGVVSLFDNRASPSTSRGVEYQVDESRFTATRIKENRHVPGVFGALHGNYEQFADGGSLVGWGSSNLVTEYDAAGAVRWEATLPGSYRTTRETWTGRPPTLPAVVVDPNGNSNTVSVSWNGATDVASWEVLTGLSRSNLASTATAPRRGFETAISVPDAPFVQVRARAADGSVLGSSAVVVGGGAWFDEQPTLAANGLYRPFAGDFTGGPGDDVLFYAPGTAAEYLWSAAADGAFRDTRAPAVNGDYHPLVGDFVGDGHDDILWTHAGEDRAYLWRADGVGGFASTAIAVPAAPVARVLPHRSAKAEVLWYNPGSGIDRVSRYRWDGALPATAVDRAITVNGTYRPVVGDFDGNGFADVVWYAAGPGADQYWRSAGTPGSGSTGQVTSTLSINGTYTPLLGRFGSNHDGRDDVVWYGPGSAVDNMWEGTAGASFVQSSHSNAATGTPVLLRGLTDQIYLSRPDTDGPVWVPGAGPEILRPAGNTPLGPGYRPISGDFGGTGVSGILWYAAGTAPERLFRPRLG